MSQILSTAHAALMAERTHYYAKCWKITRVDGTILRLTDHNSTLNVVLDPADLYAVGNPYESFDAAVGLAGSAKEIKGNLEGTNFEVTGMLSSSAITEDDLETGLYDNALVQEYLVDWRYPWLGPFFYSEFKISEIQHSEEIFIAQVEGFPYQLRQPAGDLYTKDGRVKDSVVSTVAGEVTSMLDNRRIVKCAQGAMDGTDNAYDGGTLVWTTGLNAGHTSVVREYINTGVGGAPIQITLMLDTPHDIYSGDDFNISKIEREEGFPFLPGTGNVRSIIPVKREV